MPSKWFETPAVTDFVVTLTGTVCCGSASKAMSSITEVRPSVVVCVKVTVYPERLERSAEALQVPTPDLAPRASVRKSSRPSWSVAEMVAPASADPEKVRSPGW